MTAEVELPVVVAAAGSGPSAAATTVFSVSLLPELVQAREAASAAALASGADPETAVAMGLEVRREIDGLLRSPSPGLTCHPLAGFRALPAASGVVWRRPL